MTQASPLYQLIESKLDGTLADLIAARRPGVSWDDIATELAETTGVKVGGETVRLWFVDRVHVEVTVS